MNKAFYFMKELLKDFGGIAMVFGLGTGVSAQTPEEFYNRGDGYMAKGDWDSAINAFTQGIRLNAEYIDAYNSRGYAYYCKADFDRAIADLNRVITLDPAHFAAYNLRGLSYYGKKDVPRAIADFAQSIKIYPDWADPYFNRGRVYYAENQYDAAITDFTQTIKLNPKHDSAYALRGDSYRKKGQYDAAITDSNEAVRLSPNYAFAYAVRGSAYRLKGQMDQAKADLEKALSLDATLQWAKEELQAIRGNSNTASTGANSADSAGFYPANGHRYEAVNQTLTWTEAEAEAKRRGGHLATITSAEEQKFIENLIAKNGSKNVYWIGGYRDGNRWNWVDSSSFTYTNWAPDEPNNSGGKEDKLEMWGTPPANKAGFPARYDTVRQLGQWNDSTNDSLNSGDTWAKNLGFIIEWETADLANYSGMYTIVNKNGLVLDVSGGSKDNGAEIMSFQGHGGSNQVFRFERLNDGSYTITALHSGKALEVLGAGKQNEARIGQNEYTGQANQRWYVIQCDNEYFKIINVNSGKCIDIPGNKKEPGLRLWQYQDNGTDAQRFKLIPMQ
jgi:tetratricopeptide (TPR) repeat protein